METTPQPTVAVLGLGLIGSIYARNFENAGLLAACWNRTPKPEFPSRVASPRAAAEKARALMIVVADPAAVESVIKDLLPALTPEHLVIQSSTIGPDDTTRFHAMVTKAGARYLEAPFTGSKPAAEARTTIFYLGGDNATVALAEPFLEPISAHRIHVGTGEQACTIKLAMNLQIGAQAQALCEALFLSRAAGVSDDTFFTCMKGNASWSGLSALKEPKLRAHDFSPQFSVKHLLKDLRLLKERAGELPALNILIRQLEAAAAAGEQDMDFISLYKHLR